MVSLTNIVLPPVLTGPPCLIHDLVSVLFQNTFTRSIVSFFGRLTPSSLYSLPIATHLCAYPAAW